MKKLLNLIFTFLMITNVFFGCKLEEAPDLPPPPEPEKEYILKMLHPLHFYIITKLLNAICYLLIG